MDTIGALKKESTQCVLNDGSNPNCGWTCSFCLQRASTLPTTIIQKTPTSKGVWVAPRPKCLGQRMLNLNEDTPKKTKQNKTRNKANKIKTENNEKG